MSFICSLNYLKTDGATQMGSDITDDGGTKTDLDDGNDETSPTAPVLLKVSFGFR